MRAMEKVKHLEPKFSTAIERLGRRIRGQLDGPLSKRVRTKTANRFHRRANHDDPTEHNRDFDIDNDHSISQDKTEYIAKQSDLIPDAFDLASNTYFDNEVATHTKSQFHAGDTYNLKMSGIFFV